MEEKNLILEIQDMTKAELRRFIKRMLDKETKKLDKKIKDTEMTKEDIRKIVKDMMIKQYKFFWEKKSFWVNNI
jgi:chemotaxis methyl-accepting protein methylase